MFWKIKAKPNGLKQSIIVQGNWTFVEADSVFLPPFQTFRVSGDYKISEVIDISDCKSLVLHRRQYSVV